MGRTAASRTVDAARAMTPTTRTPVRAGRQRERRKAEERVVSRRRWDITRIAYDSTANAIGLRRFRAAMLRKLDEARSKGRGGWNLPRECRVERLWEMMVEHVQKGDVVDVANFCMMIWNRRNPTGAALRTKRISRRKKT